MAWRPAILVLLTCALAGCTTGARTAEPAPSTEARAEPADSELAAQARRDVEQLRGLQDGTSAEASVRPQIEWIDTQRRTPAASSPLAHLDPPPLQTPVHRDPIKPVEVADGSTEPAETPGGAIADAVMPALEPTGDPEIDRLRQLVVELSAELYRKAAYSDMPMRELLLIAATTMVTPDRSLVPDALPGLTDRERELLATIQKHYATLGETLADTGDPEALVAAIDELHASLSRPPTLTLPRAGLCTRVGGFGDFDEFARNDAGRYAFLAHNNQEAIVYVEVEDFTSELNEQGRWVTELSQQLVVYSDRDGIPVWREAWQAGVDVSKNRRDDFFIVQIVTLPQRLSVGRYHLKIHIRDERSKAEAETTIELEMVADPRMLE